MDLLDTGLIFRPRRDDFDKDAEIYAIFYYTFWAVHVPLQIVGRIPMLAFSSHTDEPASDYKCLSETSLPGDRSVVMSCGKHPAIGRRILKVCRQEEGLHVLYSYSRIPI